MYFFILRLVIPFTLVWKYTSENFVEYLVSYIKIVQADVGTGHFLYNIRYVPTSQTVPMEIVDGKGFRMGIFIWGHQTTPLWRY